MNLTEFSNEFDTLLNSYAISNPLGIDIPVATIELDEYEKSVFLTRAQEEIIYEYYSGYNEKRLSFEETEEVRRYLSELIESKELDLTKEKDYYKTKLPEDTWFITYEVAELGKDAGCFEGKYASIIPTKQDDLYRILQNPFKRPNQKRVLRLDEDDNSVILYSKYIIDKYKLKYLAYPEPIILIDLPDDVSIRGKIHQNECKLHPMLHRLILEKAVQTAYYNKRSNFVQKQEEQKQEK